jgi:hypothetical protein
VGRNRNSARSKYRREWARRRTPGSFTQGDDIASLVQVEPLAQAEVLVFLPPSIATHSAARPSATLISTRKADHRR